MSTGNPIYIIIIIVIIIVVLLFIALGRKKGSDPVPQKGPKSDGNQIKTGTESSSNHGEEQENPGHNKDDKPITGTKPEDNTPEPHGYTVVNIPFIKNNPIFDEKEQRCVDYSLKSSVDLEFPVYRYPQKGCPIKYPVVGRNGRRGACEQAFCNRIMELGLGNNFYDNLSLFVNKSCHPFEPDLAYINKNIFIDIEIDEPYSGCTKEPIHYYNVNDKTFVDENRNAFFTERGWTVIRFTEKQIAFQKNSCIKKIFQILHMMDSTIMMPPVLKDFPELVKESAWSKSKAESMCRDKEREHYLHISHFICSYVDTLEETVLEESEYGKEYEARLIKYKDDTFWNECKSSKVDEYIDRYPDGLHIEEAKSIKASTRSSTGYEPANNYYRTYMQDARILSHKNNTCSSSSSQEITTKKTNKPTPSSRGYA